MTRMPTFLDIKKNLKDYSLKEFKSLANVLIDSVYDVTSEKRCPNKNLIEFEPEKNALTLHNYEIQEKY